MKILAIIDLVSGTQMDTIRAELANEIKKSWALFAAGVVREAYATAVPTRVIFVLEAKDTADAQRHLRELPLVAAGHFSLQLIELRPFVNWSMLFAC
jgi:hypothetical protein